MTIEQAKVRNLFLEERVSLARRMLNEHSVVFGDAMSLQMRREFNQFINDVMTALEGDPFGSIRERFK